MAPKKKISRGQAQQLLPEVAKFNSLAKMLLKLLDGNIDRKEKHLTAMRASLSKKIQKDRASNISVMTVDMNKTMVKKRGGYSYNKPMNWEEDLRNKRRGIVL
jgi:hypothetical protein